jgi:hypothetical protein
MWTNVANEVVVLPQRLDSFIELASSSIEYGASLQYEVRPAKTRVLNVKALKNILKGATALRKRQAIKASGLLRS